MVLGLLFVLAGCDLLDSDAQTEEKVDALDEVVPHYDEIEDLLAQAELEIGLSDSRSASATFAQLMMIIEGHEIEISTHQQARVDTLEELLSDTLADASHAPIFTGSAAAAKVMTYFGSAPAGYEFVYHEIPSFVGSSSLGYYVFLVPIERRDDEFETVQTFFVTDRGEILTFE